MNKNRTVKRHCRHCAQLFVASASRVVYCSIYCRLWSSVAIGTVDECWPWLGCKDKDGYGRMCWNYQMIGAHVVALRSTGEAVPDGFIAQHSCDNPPCCNPAHLAKGTHRTNAQDRTAKGRTYAPVGELNGNARIDATTARAVFVDPRRQKDIAADFGLSQPDVSRIKRRTRWRAATKGVA